MRTGVPTNVDQWGWTIGFYPASHRGLRASGTARSFDMARGAFETAWRWLLPQTTQADFVEHRQHRAHEAWKHAMRQAGCKLPTEMAGGRSRCFCGAEIDLAGTEQHVYRRTWWSIRAGQTRERIPSNAWARKIAAPTKPITAVIVTNIANVRYATARQKTAATLHSQKDFRVPTHNPDRPGILRNRCYPGTIPWREIPNPWRAITRLACQRPATFWPGHAARRTPSTMRGHPRLFCHVRCRQDADLQARWFSKWD